MREAERALRLVGPVFPDEPSLASPAGLESSPS